MAISDDYEKGLVNDLSSVDLWCQNIARQLAGDEITVGANDIENVPRVLAKGLNALLAGTMGKLAEN